MRAASPEVENSVVAVHCGLDTASGVLAEHQVLAIEPGECLFVLALDGSLDGGFQGVFDLIDQFHDREHFK